MTGIDDNRLDQLTLGAISLEELVDKGALGEMVSSFYELFRVPLRVFSNNGLLVEATVEPEVHKYLSEFPEGQRQVFKMIEDVKALQPAVGHDASYECFTGAIYRVAAIAHDGRHIGRLVLGPYLPPTLKQVPKPMLDLQGPNPQQLKELLAKMPRARNSTVAQIARHLQTNLDLILHSGHKALLTSSMHLATVRENYRDLEEKNQALQEAFDQLKELDELKSNFLATVSHELRTPLTSIIGFSEMLAEGIGGPLTDDQKEFVQTIHEKGKQLLELISGLLDLSKLESGTLALNRSMISVPDVVEDVFGTLQPQARKGQVELLAKMSPEVPELWVDGTRLRQILLNLVDNALKFTPAGGHVEVLAQRTMMGMSADDDEGAVLFSGSRPAVELIVSDTGSGIPDAAKPKVFDAFYQVDNGATREVGGTGLGLSIVRRLVESHSGSVSVRDSDSGGAAFAVVLPIDGPQEA